MRVFVSWLLAASIGCGGGPATPTTTALPDTAGETDRASTETEEEDPEAEALFAAAEELARAADEPTGSHDRTEAVRRAADAYDAVIARRRPRWTIAALVRQAALYVAEAEALRTEPFVAPPGLVASLAPLPPAERDRRLAELEASHRAALEPTVRAIECIGFARYVLVRRAVRVRGREDAYSRAALLALTEAGEESVRECVERQRLGDRTLGVPPDPTFAPYDRRDLSQLAE